MNPMSRRLVGRADGAVLEAVLGRVGQVVGVHTRVVGHGQQLAAAGDAQALVQGLDVVVDRVLGQLQLRRDFLFAAADHQFGELLHAECGYLHDLRTHKRQAQDRLMTRLQAMSIPADLQWWIFLALFFVVPFYSLVATSLYDPNGSIFRGYEMEWAFSNYPDALREYWVPLVRSLWYGALATLGWKPRRS